MLRKIAVYYPINWLAGFHRISSIDCIPMHLWSLTWFTWNSAPGKGDSELGNHHFQVLVKIWRFWTCKFPIQARRSYLVAGGLSVHLPPIKKTNSFWTYVWIKAPLMIQHCEVLYDAGNSTLARKGLRRSRVYIMHLIWNKFKHFSLDKLEQKTICKRVFKQNKTYTYTYIYIYIFTYK